MKGLAASLGLAPHPEGGWFRETWRADTLVETPRGPRPAGTSILYLLEGGAASRLHRLAWDEVWHLHAGGPLRLHLLGCESPRIVTLSADGGAPLYQATVPAGTWFGAEADGGWALAGCTMAPGFDFADFELGRRDQLLAAHPAAAGIVQRLTDPDPGRNP
jgi:predicted cupin superfamily sugar epimerase